MKDLLSPRYEVPGAQSTPNHPPNHPLNLTPTPTPTITHSYPPLTACRPPN